MEPLVTYFDVASPMSAPVLEDACMKMLYSDMVPNQHEKLLHAEENVSRVSNSEVADIYGDQSDLMNYLSQLFMPIRKDERLRVRWLAPSLT